MSSPWRPAARAVPGALLPPLLAFALARVVLSAAALSAGEDPWRPGSWCRFDCAHYMRIAVKGYDLFPCPADSDSAGLWCGNTAWLPGYPLLVRATRSLGPAPRAAAVLVSGAFAFLTLVLLWAVLTRRASGGPADPPAPPRTSALLTLALAAFFPGAVYAHAIFPLGLFGFATVLALVFASRSRPVAAGLAGAAAAFTYTPGIMMAAVLGAGFLLRGGDGLPPRVRRAALSSLLTVGGFVAVLALQRWETGSWWGFWLVLGGYGNDVHNPLASLVERIVPLFRPPFEGADEAPVAQTLLVVLLVISGAMGAVRAAKARSFGALESFAALYAAVFWLLPLVLGGAPENGLHRREATALPLVLLTAQLPRAWQAVLAAAAAALAYPMALLFFRGALI